MTRETQYARWLRTSNPANDRRIERIHVKKNERDEIRFSWWPNGRFAPRPLDLPEDELLPLFRNAIEENVFSTEFLIGLRDLLNEKLDA